MALVEVYGGQRSFMFVNLNFSCSWPHQTTIEYNLLNIPRKISSEYVSVFYLG